jgi:CheY-like chemotaxis protein
MELFTNEQVGRPCRVLIVDDDRTQLELMRVLLLKAGLDLNMKSALTIEDALSSLAEQQPDIVFLDNHMPPEMDFRSGFGMLRDAGYGGPVIVNSVSIDEPVMHEAGAFGVTRIVDKFELRDELLRELIFTYGPERVARLDHDRNKAQL